jgi:lipopolysaccharide/colanic/teichoic acid biosynthesis glycosyltransferase
VTPTTGTRRNLRVLNGEVSLTVESGGRATATAAPVADKLTRWRGGIKRGMDVVGALVLLAVALPLFVVVAVAIRLESRGPVFFAHRRLGRDGRHFDCLKFRSMRDRAEQVLFDDHALRHQYVTHHFKVPAHADPRITRVGRVLRMTSLDELPQLLNVLRGEMSLIGPRPIVALEATHYGDHIDELLSVRPGITGAWAVGGRNAVGYPERAQVELQYVRDPSLRRDLAILARTPWAVLSQRGTI